MPGVQPPDPSTYSRVLRRYDRDPRLTLRYATYDVNLQSKPVEMWGRVASTLFVPPGKETAALRATRLGWHDETESFAAFLAGAPDPKAKPKPPPVPTEVPEADEPEGGPLRGKRLFAYLDSMHFFSLRKLATTLGVAGKGKAELMPLVVERLEANGGYTPATE